MAIDRTGKYIDDSIEKRREKRNRLKIAEKEKDALVEGKDGQCNLLIPRMNVMNKSLYYQIAEPERKRKVTQTKS